VVPLGTTDWDTASSHNKIKHALCSTVGPIRPIGLTVPSGLLCVNDVHISTHTRRMQPTFHKVSVFAFVQSILKLRYTWSDKFPKLSCTHLSYTKHSKMDHSPDIHYYSKKSSWAISCVKRSKKKERTFQESFLSPSLGMQLMAQNDFTEFCHPDSFKS
jgi:hypothetical protein